MPKKKPLLLPMLALAAVLVVPAPTARADLMTACAAEIDALCPDVSRGRGRVSACLEGYRERLGAACRPEVRAMAGGRLVPGDVRKIFDPGFRAVLPAACAAPAAQLCPGVPPGDGRVFACLYARADRAGAACSDAARATLRHAN